MKASDALSSVAALESALATACVSETNQSPLEDDTVALLVISRSPRDCHAALAAVCKGFAQIVLSPTLRKERVASGWLDGPAPPMYRVSRDRAHILQDDDQYLGDGGLKWLFSEQQQHIMLILNGLVALDAPDVGTALVDFYSNIVGAFYGVELIMRVDPQHVSRSFALIPAFSMRGLGGLFSHHLLVFAQLLDDIVANYDRAQCETVGSLSFYGRRLVDAGLLREHFDERSQTWTIDTDGRLISDLRKCWTNGLCPDEPCPIDAAMIIVYAYIVVMANPGAKEKLLRETRGRIVKGGMLDAYLPGGRWKMINDVLGMHVQLLDSPGIAATIMGNIRMMKEEDARMGPEFNILGMPRSDTQEGRDLAAAREAEAKSGQ